MLTKIAARGEPKFTLSMAEGNHSGLKIESGQLKGYPSNSIRTLPHFDSVRAFQLSTDSLFNGVMPESFYPASTFCSLVGSIDGSLKPRYRLQRDNANRGKPISRCSVAELAE